MRPIWFCVFIAVAAACGAPPHALCGDGVCDGDEDPSSCCEDCGCAGEQECSAGMCVAPSVVMHWGIENGCFNGESILIKFFDVDRGVEWPAPAKAYSVAPGATQDFVLLCTPGDWICLGGQQPQHHLYWGVDIDNSKSCTQCCVRCAVQAGTTTTLMCNG